jgi:hypothetical protein
MTLLRCFLAAALLIAGAAYSQSAGEIAFWESVRDSRNPAELQAYIDQFPNGTFVVIAKSRLATLQKSAPAAAPGARPAPPATPPVTALATPASRYPAAGDTWTYRLSYPRLRGQWGQTTKPARTHIVTVTQANASVIEDEVSVDGGTPLAAKHAKGGLLIDHGAPIFSPYLATLEDLPASGRLRGVAIADSVCSGTYLCEVKGSVAGRETITVPAGTFEATRIVVTHEWRPASGSVMHAAQMAQYQGGRTLTVWYVPALKRAVKYSSRLVAGDVPPVDPTFDLELVSYQLK